MQASLWLTVRTCENISLKIADSLKYPLTLNSLKNSISTYNVGTLSEIQNLSLHDFGIYLDLEPEEEEKAQLEQNIQIALQKGGIDLEDAIDIRRIKNLKLANDVLKQKRKKREKAAQAMQQQNDSSSSRLLNAANSRKNSCWPKFKKQQAISSNRSPKCSTIKLSLKWKCNECKWLRKLSNKKCRLDISLAMELYRLANVQLGAVREKEAI